MTDTQLAIDGRAGPAAQLAADAELVAAASRDMAERFRAGGRLLVFGTGGAAADAQHVAVEFVHPVIVGKRALPALTLTADVATLTGVAAARGVTEVFAHQLRLLGSPDDIALGIVPDGRDPAVLAGLEVAAEAGLLTVALTGGDGGEVAASGAVRHSLVAASQDPLVVREIQVTTYHILWELVHVWLERAP
jgi:D-sedoheptulose 7-phosphate isomerase